MAEPNLDPGEGQQQQGGGNGADLPDDIEALKAALAKERAAKGQLINENKGLKSDRNTLSAGLKKWNKIAADRGINPEDIDQLLAEREKAELARARDTGEVDKLLDNQKRKFEQTLAEREEELAKSKALNNALLIDAALENGLDQVKVKPQLKPAAFALHRPRMKVIQDPDAPRGVRAVVDVDGNSSNYMDIGPWLKNWAENDSDAGEFLIGNQSVGGGAPGSASALARLGLKKRSKMTAAEKSQYIRANGIEAYNKLDWA